MKQKLINPVCLCCGSLFVQNFLFCNDCFDTRIRQIIAFSNGKEVQKNLKTYHLFEWKRGQSDMLSEFVYRFKSDRCLEAWKFYGNLACSKFIAAEGTSEIDFIVPVPGSKKKSYHAQIFAKIVSEQTGIPILDILEKKLHSDSQEGEQKHRNRVERSRITIFRCEQFTQFPEWDKSEKRILVVDDIKTSGNSFRQVLKALGSVKSATLLTLFSREKEENTALVS